MALRWRNSGLEAIRSLVSADALSSVNGRQYDVVVPTDPGEPLDRQRRLPGGSAAEGADGGRRWRPGFSSRGGRAWLRSRTADTGGNEANTNPIALMGSAFDVDKLAEEDTGVLAMQCLKQIFEVPNRSLIQLPPSRFSSSSKNV